MNGRNELKYMGAVFLLERMHEAGYLSEKAYHLALSRARKKYSPAVRE